MPFFLIAERQHFQQRADDGHDNEAPGESEDGRAQRVYEPTQEAANHCEPGGGRLKDMDEVVRGVPA
ncbi:hypothetical protein D9M72_562560 [compost metagenome]